MKAAWGPIGLRAGFRCNCVGRPTIQYPMRAAQQSLLQGHSLRTSARRGDSIAAHELDLSDPRWAPGRGRLLKEQTGDEVEQKKPTVYARVVPASPAYYSRLPHYLTDLLHLQELAIKCRRLPRLKKGDQVRRVIWITDQQYKARNGETLGPSRFRRLLEITKDFNKIVPDIRPEAVEKVIKSFAYQIDPARPRPTIPTPDEYGRTIALGRRKSAQGRAFLVAGTGEAYVNGKPMAEFFRRVHDRETVIWALKQAGRIDKYNLWGVVKGGGTTGQAEALALAVGKALVGQEPGLRIAIRRYGCLSRDNRRVERKKPGRLKARKMPTWVKR